MESSYQVLPVQSRADIPKEYLDTPIGDLLECHREIEVRIRERGIGGDRTLEAGHSGSSIATLVLEEAQIVERFGLALVDRKRLPIVDLGLIRKAAPKAHVAEIREGVGEARARAISAELRCLDRQLIQVVPGCVQVLEYFRHPARRLLRGDRRWVWA